MSESHRVRWERMISPTDTREYVGLVALVQEDQPKAGCKRDKTRNHVDSCQSDGSCHPLL
jgi:hypothetical protein